MKTQRKRSPRAWLRRGLVGVLLAAAACIPSYGTVEFEAVSNPPVPVTIRSFLIEMPAGVAAVVRARPISENRNEYDSSYKVDLFSADRDILVVERRPSRREFVLIGVNPGSTCLEVEIDGRPEDCIDVEILPPEGG